MGDAKGVHYGYIGVK